MSGFLPARAPSVLAWSTEAARQRETLEGSLLSQTLFLTPLSHFPPLAGQAFSLRTMLPIMGKPSFSYSGSFHGSQALKEKRASCSVGHSRPSPLGSQASSAFPRPFSQGFLSSRRTGVAQPHSLPSCVVRALAPTECCLQPLSRDPDPAHGPKAVPSAPSVGSWKVLGKQTPGLPDYPER